MLLNPVIYAIIAGISMGMWIIFHKYASVHVPQALGATIVSLFAVLCGVCILVGGKVDFSEVSILPIGVALLFLAGLSAFSLDIFTLKAFSSGLPSSVGGPIILGLGTALPAFIGVVFLGEDLDWQKFLSVIMIIVGCIILSTK